MRTIVRTALSVCSLALTLAQINIHAATLSISPNAIGDDYKGSITLQIGGLNAGETINVERLSDLNGDGAADSYDFTMQAFPLTDGQSTVIGSVTNLHVPGDMNSTAGDITAKIHTAALNFQQRAIGKSLYRVTSPTSRFAPVTASFTVTNATYASQLGGRVTCNGSSVPYALVVLFVQAGDDMQPALIAATDDSGNYSVKAPPGFYMVASMKSNYVANLAAPMLVNLSSGGSATADLSVTASTRKISGRVSDKDNSSRGLGGLLTIAESKTSGYLALAFTDAAGNFSAGTTPGQWQIGTEDTDMHFLGYVGSQNRTAADCTSGDVTGLSIQATKGTALIYGTVATDTSVPMPALPLWATDFTRTYSVTPHADGNGRYFAPVVAGSWEVGVDETPLYPGYIFSGYQNISVTNGSATLQNFTGKQAPYLISGYLKDSSQMPVAGVRIWGNVSRDGITYITRGMTDDTGLYSMRAFNGQWNIDSACDGDEGLRAHGYKCTGNGIATVANANATANLLAEPCTSLQIVTTSLPNARVNQSYNQALIADSCNGNYFWNLAPGSGSLPPGMNLQNTGFLSGAPTQAGTWNFIIQVQDGTTTVTKQLSLTVENNSIPLAVVTSSLAEATNGVPYSVRLSATGGAAPYSWSLAPGSGPLPSGLSLNTSGDVTGTPTQAGEFWFRARVTDTAQGTAESLIRIVVVIASAPLNITTTALAGTVGVPFNQSLQATGGHVPYFWSIALGSAGVPAGLSMNSSGQISGTPLAAGTFYFIANVTDSAMPSMSDEQLVTFTINNAARPVFAGASLGSNGKIQFQINGTQGTTYTVQASADFATWFDIGITNAPSNSFILETTPPPGDRGFIRLKVGL